MAWVVRVAAWLMIVVALAPLARGQEPGATAPVPTLQKTKVLGTPPEGLGGRWLALGLIKLPSGIIRNNPALWEVTGAGSEMTLYVRIADLPGAQKQAADAASAGEKAWEPTREDLQAIAAGWDSLPPQAARTVTVETDLSSHDAFDEAARGDSMSKDALWLVRQTFTLDETAAPVIRQAAVYAATTRSTGPWAWEGNYTYVILAAAPFPIPITLNGSFRLYPLSPPTTGLLVRLFDALKGCGRR